MKVSLLQPEIIRGNINYNSKKVQKLVNQSSGDLLVLPEYVFTGSLVLDKQADLDQWCKDVQHAKEKIIIPTGKILMINSLVNLDGKKYNCCQLLPTTKKQIKVHPDQTERIKGIVPGQNHDVFTFYDKKFKILICSDFKYWKLIETAGLDFVIWVYHFTAENYQKRITELRNFVHERKIPVLVSSLVSDQNSGMSLYIEDDKIVALSKHEGILEVEFDQQKHRQ